MVLHGAELRHADCILDAGECKSKASACPNCRCIPKPSALGVRPWGVVTGWRVRVQVNSVLVVCLPQNPELVYALLHRQDILPPLQVLYWPTIPPGSS